MKTFSVIPAKAGTETLKTFSVIPAKAGTETLKPMITSQNSAFKILVVDDYPDLHLLDVMLPDISGIEVCSRIKNDPGLSSIFVLLLPGTCEIRLRHKNGGIVWIASFAKYITGQARNRHLILYGGLVDITGRKQTEQEISVKNQELIKLNAEKDKFFSIIANDMRSPFNGFLGFTDLLVQDLDTLTQEEIQTIATRMRSSAINLFGLLENMLEWSRMQQGLIPFNRKTVKLYPIISGSMSTVMEPAKNKGIEIEYRIPEDLTISADINMLMTIIRNLATNAVKFTRKGGKINISARATSDDLVEISIKDSGIGMSSSMVDDLFGLGDNTNRKGTEGEPSTGLGLVICKDFIEKHGGKIWVESEEGKGNTFRFTFTNQN